MGALLRQLTSSKPDLPVKEPVAIEYEARRKKAAEDCSSLKKLTVQDCTRLIIELTQDYPATIILDALDECEENTRYELLEAFDDIISSSAEVVKVFVSSRDDIDIVSSLRENMFSVLRIGVQVCLQVRAETWLLTGIKFLEVAPGKFQEYLNQRREQQ